MLYVRSNMFMKNNKVEGEYIPTRNVFALNEKELYGDIILTELEMVYNKKIYNKEDVPGVIKYLNKEKE